MTVDKMILYVTIQWKTIFYVFFLITKIQLFLNNTSQTKSQGNHGKIRGLLYNLNISYIFCTYSQCQNMDEVKVINLSGS